MNENGGPKIIENIVKKEEKRRTNAKCTLKNNAKCNPKIMQNVVQNQ